MRFKIHFINISNYKSKILCHRPIKQSQLSKLKCLISKQKVIKHIVRSFTQIEKLLIRTFSPGVLMQDLCVRFLEENSSFSAFDIVYSFHSIFAHLHPDVPTSAWICNMDSFTHYFPSAGCNALQIVFYDFQSSNLELLRAV